MTPATPWCRVEIFGAGDGKEWSNVYWYRPDVSIVPSSFNPKDVSDQMDTDWGSLYKDSLITTRQYFGTSIQINFGSGTFGAKTYNIAYGTVSGAECPEDVASLVQLYTGQGGRSYTGRKYYSMVPQSFVQGSYLSTTGLSQMTLVASNSAAIITVDAMGLHPCVYSKKLGTLTEIIGGNPVSELATQRHRRGRF